MQVRFRHAACATRYEGACVRGLVKACDQLPAHGQPLWRGHSCLVGMAGKHPYAGLYGCLLLCCAQVRFSYSNVALNRPNTRPSMRAMLRYCLPLYDAVSTHPPLPLTLRPSAFPPPSCPLVALPGPAQH